MVFRIDSLKGTPSPPMRWTKERTVQACSTYYKRGITKTTHTKEDRCTREVAQPKQQQQQVTGSWTTNRTYAAKRGNTKRGDGHNDNNKDRDDDQSCSNAGSGGNDNMDENGGETDNVV